MPNNGQPYETMGTPQPWQDADRPGNGECLATIVLINRNGGEYLRRALASCSVALERAWREGGRFEFIVVDNGSTDGSLAWIDEQLRDAPFPVRVVEEPCAGVNYARNAGIRAARGEYLIFTDNDLEFSPNWLSAYIEAFAAFPKHRLFAGRVRVGRVEGPAPAWLALDGEYGRPAIVVQMGNGEQSKVFLLGQAGVAGPVGANMAMHRLMFQEHGLFDVHFGLRPGSSVPGAEAEYFCRLEAERIEWVYVADAMVEHPLKANQISKTYFLKRLHGIGRVAARIRRLRAAPCKRIFGMTLYVFEYLLRAWLAYARAVARGDRKAAFYHRGDAAIQLGFLHEDLAHYWRSFKKTPLARLRAREQE